VIVMDLEEREWPLLGGYNVAMGMVEDSDADADGIVLLFEDRKGGYDPGWVM
jgi:hypothetical protein